MDVNVCYLYSLDDLIVGFADILIFVQEMVLQEQLLDIC